MASKSYKVLPDGSKHWYKRNPETVRRGKRAYSARLKADTIKRYGGVCACCGESSIVFLTIDHTHGGGNQHRALIGLGRQCGERFYLWLKKNDYPDGYGVLCFNCNFGKWANGGVCPHQTSK